MPCCLYGGKCAPLAEAADLAVPRCSTAMAPPPAISTEAFSSAARVSKTPSPTTNANALAAFGLPRVMGARAAAAPMPTLILSSQSKLYRRSKRPRGVRQSMRTKRPMRSKRSRLAAQAVQVAQAAQSALADFCDCATCSFGKSKNARTPPRILGASPRPPFSFLSGTRAIFNRPQVTSTRASQAGLDPPAPVGLSSALYLFQITIKSHR